MPSVFLYLIIICIWSTTWFAINFQKGVASEELSVFLRFFISGSILMIYLALRGKLSKRSFRDHVTLFIKGVGLFGIDYVCIYHAAKYLVSGVNASVYASVVLVNMILCSRYFKRPMTKNLVGGCVLGFTGLCLFFWPQLQQNNFEGDALWGLFFGISAVLGASVGHVASEVLHRNAVPVGERNAYSMLYGAFFSLVVAVIQGDSFTLPSLPSYWYSLAYLSIFGSILTFGCYITLLERMGGEKVGLPLIVIPVFSLFVSQVFENYTWTPLAILGILGIIGGNLWALWPQSALKKKKMELPPLRGH